jgi:pyruvoyl-dependent arginine decarboxylase (PvlArgDC)
LAVIDVNAKIEPRNTVVVSSVAELPTCQNTLQADAPLMRLTVLLGAVMSVLPAWKMNTAPGSFCASKVTVPVRPIELALL